MSGATGEVVMVDRSHYRGCVFGIGILLLGASGCSFDTSGLHPTPVTSDDRGRVDRTPPKPVDSSGPKSERGVLDRAIKDQRRQDIKAPLDKPRPVDKAIPKDTLVPKDKPVPDKGLPGLDGGGPGDPCPCKPPYLCIQSYCRIPCSSGTCNESVACPAGQGCWEDAGQWGCMPGLTYKAQCTGKPNPCAKGLLCVKAGRSTVGTCRNTCEPSTSTGSCNCYKVGSGPCHVCLP